jgi:hypothetical protein
MLMPESLFALVLLACPVGMGLMMWMMRDKHPPTDVSAAAKRAELAGLQAQIDQLQAQRDHELGDHERAGAARQPQS